MRKVISFQTNEQALNGKDSTSLISALTGFKRACGSSQLLESITNWVVSEVISGPALAAIMARLTQSSNDSYRCEATKMTYGKVVNHVLR